MAADNRRRLIHSFAPALLRANAILQMVEEKSEAERYEVPVIALQNEMEELVRASQRNAEAAAGLEVTEARRREVERAAYVVVAYFDDALARFHGLRYDTLATVQYRMFANRVAGDKVFEDLGQLGQQERDLREICALVLGLGFRGRAAERDGLTDKAMLERWINQLRVNLEPVPLYSAEQRGKEFRLTPQPYGVTLRPAKEVKPERCWACIIGGIAAAALALVVGYFLLFGSPDGKARAAKAFEGIACANVEVHTVEGDRRRVRLTGYHGDEADLRQRLEGLSRQGITADGSGLIAAPAPLCSVLRVLDDAGVARNGPTSATLSPTLREPRYEIGHTYFGTVTPRSAEAQHLTVLYVKQSSPGQGLIATLLPAESAPDAQHRPGAEIRIGRPYEEITRRDGGLAITGTEGAAMVVAISSPRRLLDPAAPAIWSDVSTTLSRLREGLAQQRSSREQPQAPVASHAIFSVVPTQSLVLRMRAELQRQQPVCGRVQAMDRGGQVVLRGHVTSEASIAELLAIGGNAVDRSQLRIIPPPFCEALQSLDQLSVLDQPGAPEIILPTTGSARFARGDDFWLDIRLREPFEGFVTAFYMHPQRGLLPLGQQGQGRGSNFAAGAELRFRGPIGRGWRIEQPAGAAMVIVLLTRTRILPQGNESADIDHRRLPELLRAAGDTPRSSTAMLTITEGPGR